MRAMCRVLIPDGEDELALRVLRCLAQTPRMKVTVLSRDRGAPIRYSRHVDRFFTHCIAGLNHQRVEAIKSTAKQVGADIILPTGLPGIRLVAEFRQEFESIAQLPPLTSAETLDALADKVRFSEILEREGIPHPKILRPDGGRIQESQIAEIGLPALVKPRNLEGGNGIRLCQSSHQIIDYLKDQEDPREFFVQEFINGTDLSCNILSRDGEVLAHTIQKGIVNSRKSFSPPAAIEFVHNQGVLDSIQKLVRSLRWSGVVNFDLVLDEQANQAKVLEANPRYWRSLLGSLAAGVNFPYLACMAAQGEKIPTYEYRHVRYSRPEVAISLLLRSWTGMASPISRMSESGLSYVARDPGPDLAIQFSRISKRLAGYIA